MYRHVEIHTFASLFCIFFPAKFSAINEMKFASLFFSGKIFCYTWDEICLNFLYFFQQIFLLYMRWNLPHFYVFFPEKFSAIHEMKFASVFCIFYRPNFLLDLFTIFIILSRKLSNLTKIKKERQFFHVHCCISENLSPTNLQF